jgi:hypothetical protein
MPIDVPPIFFRYSILLPNLQTTTQIDRSQAALALESISFPNNVGRLAAVVFPPGTWHANYLAQIGTTHLIHDSIGEAFHILFSEDLLERSKDRIIIFSRL